MVSETNGGHMKRALYTLHHDEGLLRARYWGSPRYGTPNVSYQVVVQSQVVTIKFDTF